MTSSGHGNRSVTLRLGQNLYFLLPDVRPVRRRIPPSERASSQAGPICNLVLNQAGRQASEREAAFRPDPLVIEADGVQSRIAPRGAWGLARGLGEFSQGEFLNGI